MPPNSEPEHPEEPPNLDFEPTLKGLAQGEKVFGERYSLIRILGRGGMGVVWLAEDLELEQQVALKFLPEFVAMDKVALDDLKQETRQSLKLTHSNIVRTFTFHSDQQLAAIAMEYIDGETLSEHRLTLENRVFEPTDSMFQDWLRRIFLALIYAHEERHIVHRDLKPSNLMVTSRGEVKVADFGIARGLNESRTRLTKTNSATASSCGGTLAYMSPQQALGGTPSVSDDIYSLGATLYELVTGKPPFYSGEIYEQIKIQEPPTLSHRREELSVESKNKIPSEWEELIAASLSKNPEDRPDSIAEFASMIGLAPDGSAGPMKTAKLSRKKKRKKKPGAKAPKLAVAALVVAAVGVAGWWFGHEQPRKVKADAVLVTASQAYAEGDIPTASLQLARLFNIYPGHRDGTILKSRVSHEATTRFETAAGRAEAAMAAQDFLTAKEAFELILQVKPDHEKTLSSLAEISKIEGAIKVVVTPLDAEVAIDLENVEPLPSPATFESIPLGKRKISAIRPGYEPGIAEIAIRNGKPVPVKIDLVRETGGLKVDSAPSGLPAKVVCLSSSANLKSDLDFLKEGTTPLKLEDLPTGKYAVSVEREGWPPYRQEFEVKAAGQFEVQHKFPESSVSFVSENVAAEIWGKGKLLGETPLTVKLPPGTFSFVFKKNGYADHSLTRILADDSESVIKVELTKNRTALEWAELAKKAIPEASENYADQLRMEREVILIHARLQEYGEALRLIESIDTFMEEGKESKIDSIWELGKIQARHQDFDKAFETMDRLSISNWKRFRFAGFLGEQLGKLGRRDLALASFKEMDKSYKACKEEDPSYRTPLQMARDLSVTGTFLVRGGFETEGLTHLAMAEGEMPKVKDSFRAVLEWSAIGQRYCEIGRTDDLIRAKSMMTEQDSIAPVDIYLGWSLGFSRVFGSRGLSEAERYRDSGRKVISRAKSSYSALDVSSYDKYFRQIEWGPEYLTLIDQGEIENAISLFHKNKGDLYGYAVGKFSLAYDYLLEKEDLSRASEFLEITLKSSGFKNKEDFGEPFLDLKGRYCLEVAKMSCRIYQMKGDAGAEDHIKKLKRPLERHLSYLQIAKHLSPVPDEL